MYNDIDSLKQCIFKTQMKELGSLILRFVYVPMTPDWSWPQQNLQRFWQSLTASSRAFKLWKCEVSVPALNDPPWHCFILLQGHPKHSCTNLHKWCVASVLEFLKKVKNTIVIVKILTITSAATARLKNCMASSRFVHCIFTDHLSTSPASLIKSQGCWFFLWYRSFLPSGSNEVLQLESTGIQSYYPVAPYVFAFSYLKKGKVNMEESLVGRPLDLISFAMRPRSSF